MSVLSTTSRTPSPSTSTTPPPAQRGRLTGRVITGALAAFLVVDAAGKLGRFDFALEATGALGFADHHVVLIGALLAVGVVAHLVPRTAFVGAVYLTAYLGGAVAAHVRTDNVASVVFRGLRRAAVGGLRPPRAAGACLGPRLSVSALQERRAGGRPRRPRPSVGHGCCCDRKA